MLEGFKAMGVSRRLMVRFGVSSLVLVLSTQGMAESLATLEPLPPERPRPILESEFCWITGVDRSPRGVAVHFKDRRTVTVTSPPDRYRTERIFDPAYVPYVSKERAEAAVMHLEIGSKFLMSNSPEDTCSGEVVRNSKGEVGVFMQADFVIDGQSDSAEDFLHAQPSDAIVREVNNEHYGFFASWPQEVATIAPLRKRFEKDAKDAEAGLIRMAKSENDARDAAKRPANALQMYHDTKVAGDNAHLLSLLTDGFAYTGGAHGMSGYDGELWDRKKNRTIKDATTLFADKLQALRAPYCKALDAQRVLVSEGAYTPQPGKKYNDIWDCPSFSTLEIVPVGAPGKPFDRLRIIAAPYIAGPYSDGTYDISFPMTADLIALVKPQYRAAFAPYTPAG